MPTRLLPTSLNLWTPGGVSPIKSDLSFVASVSATGGALGMLVAVCVAQVGSLFSADAWNNVTFTAGEVKDPRRNLPLSLALGTGLVITLYLLANVAYLCVLPLEKIQHARGRPRRHSSNGRDVWRRGRRDHGGGDHDLDFWMLQWTDPRGARVSITRWRRTDCFSDRQDDSTRGTFRRWRWCCRASGPALLVLPRTRLRDPVTNAPVLDATGMEQYGNLYGMLLDYVVFAVLIFYVLTIAGVFVLRRTQPQAERPYRAFGYPMLPAFYIVAATVILLVLAALPYANFMARSADCAGRCADLFSLEKITAGLTC